MILLGYIIAAHGINGCVIIRSFTDPITNICRLNTITKTHRAIKLKLVRMHKNNIICYVDDIDNRNDAMQMKGMQIFCRKDALPILKQEDVFYVELLKDLPVVNKDMIVIGVIKNIFNFGAGDIIEIEGLDGDFWLLPFTKEIFIEITKDYVTAVIPNSHEHHY